MQRDCSGPLSVLKHLSILVTVPPGICPVRREIDARPPKVSVGALDNSERVVTRLAMVAGGEDTLDPEGDAPCLVR